MSELAFFKEPYEEYTKNYQSLINQLNFDYFIAYSISYVILYVAIPLMLGNGKTLGRLLLKIVVSNKDDKHITALNWQKFVSIVLLQNFVPIIL